MIKHLYKSIHKRLEDIILQSNSYARVCSIKTKFKYYHYEMKKYQFRLLDLTTHGG